MKIVIIGGGPAGMMAAISAKETNPDAEVLILEKMERLGRKLLITGKGRCNITSGLDISDFVKNVPGNGMFMYSAFNKYTNNDIIEFMENQGVKVKEERGHRIFPVSDKSQDVLDAFIQKLKQLQVKIKTNAQVTKIDVNDNNEVKGVKVNFKDNKEEYIAADKIILATGGKSYPNTGSTGEGYKLAKELGHTITEIKPSLVPMETYEKDVCKNLQGLSLRNVSIRFVDGSNNKAIYEDFGEMIFTHFGVSGPTILSGSSHLLRYKNSEELLKNKKIKLIIDLKPALSIEKLDLRIRKDFEEFKNKQFQNSLDKLLPKKMIQEIISLSKIEPLKRVNEITKEERLNLVKLLKNFELTFKDFRSIDDAIITAGGINIKEINPSTMESKIIKNLYFAGEIIDVDAYTGGFNLQIAYSTGYVAGGNAW